MTNVHVENGGILYNTTQTTQMKSIIDFRDGIFAKFVEVIDKLMAPWASIASCGDDCQKQAVLNS